MGAAFVIVILFVRHIIWEAFGYFSIELAE